MVSSKSNSKNSNIGFPPGDGVGKGSELLDAEGRLLTERFFFGEEDIEFSMRMEAQGVKMACVLDSVIYHKVGASGSRMSGLGKIYLHYLNRFVDIHIHKSSLFYTLWALANIPFCVKNFYRASHSISKTLTLMCHLFSDASKKQSVSRDDFEALVINGNYFDKV